MQDHMRHAMAAPATAPVRRRTRTFPAAVSRPATPPARFTPLFRDGEVRGMVEVEPDGMVDFAVRQLGARLVAVGIVIAPRN